ncbi:MAG: RagB/SusD family nutrient uptake outer membrane protein [Muribaculaceae bacterium]|nr:RagB/SusD family nutrient uptake outer membrane protein [Muribaculaceae bacterium]
MKSFNKFLVAAAIVASSMSLGSCVGDLDLLPTDPRELTAAEFAKDPEGYMNKVLGDVYLQFATFGADGNASVQGFDGGMSSFQRAIFNLEEVPSDEANWLPTDDVDFATMQYGYISPSNKALFGTYSRMTINISLCNDFIQTVRNGYFNLGSDDLRAKAEEYIRQCRVLRGGCYFYLLTLFGNVPYADESTPTGSVPAQLPRAEVFNRVVADLEAVSEEYGASQTPVYGFVGKDVADAILCKLYLNAEVFAGRAEWGKCLAKAEAIINRLKGAGYQNSGLAAHYQSVFAGNNQQYALGGSNAVNENIWVIPSSEEHLKNYSGSTLLIEGFIASQGVQETLKEPVREDYDDEAAYKKAVADYKKKLEKAEPWQLEVAYSFAGKDYSFNPNVKGWCIKDWYNVSQAGWKCMTAREQFVDKFDWLDDDCSVSNDTRVKSWMTSAFNFSKTNGVLDQAHFGSNGYLPIKYTNFNLDENGEVMPVGEGSPVGQDCANADYVVIRLAEIYLSAAEAILHGAGSNADALRYVNLIRGRAGLAAWTAADLTLETLQDERCRELYTENCRRTDLIRYGKWLSGYTWNWKAGVAEGANLPERCLLYPLPASIVTLAGYTQNPGY